MAQKKLNPDVVIFKTARDVVDALRLMYPANEYALIEQVANGTGAGVGRWADCIVMNLWPSRGLTILGIEVKVSRYDWQKELSNPQKADDMARYCDGWILAVGDESIVRNGELPDGWGLAVPETDRRLRMEVTPRLKKERPEPDRGFLGAVLRRAQEQITEGAVLAKEFARGCEQGKEESIKDFEYVNKRFVELEKKVREFDRHSGLSIEWSSPESIAGLGAAVREAKGGTVGKLRGELRHLLLSARRVAQSIEQELKQVEPVSTSAGDDGSP